LVAHPYHKLRRDVGRHNLASGTPGGYDESFCKQRAVPISTCIIGVFLDVNTPHLPPSSFVDIAVDFRKERTGNTLHPG